MQSMQPCQLDLPKYFIEEANVENLGTKNKISLQNLTRENLEDFFIWASDNEVAKYMTWEAYTSKEEAYNFLINVVENHPYFKAIVFEGKVIGSITLSLNKGDNACRANLGYVLSRDYWGKGITSIAVKKAIQEGFAKLNLSRIEAFVDPDNIASQRVLEKVGMQREGLLKNYLIFKGQIRDRHIYSITNNISL